jgi:hypothetical protein
VVCGYRALKPVSGVGSGAYFISQIFLISIIFVPGRGGVNHKGVELTKLE